VKDGPQKEAEKKKEKGKKGVLPLRSKRKRRKGGERGHQIKRKPAPGGMERNMTMGKRKCERKREKKKKKMSAVLDKGR